MSDFDGDQTLTKVFLSPEVTGRQRTFLVGWLDRSSGALMLEISGVFQGYFLTSCYYSIFISAKFVPNSIAVDPYFFLFSDTGASRAGVASVFCEHLACEHLEQPLGPRRRGDLSGKNFLCGHWSAIIRGIRVVSCANHCPFKGDAGKQTLAPAVGIDCGYWRDRSLHVPTYRPGGHTNATS
jgi:hypothetical protein